MSKSNKVVRGNQTPEKAAENPKPSFWKRLWGAGVRGKTIVVAIAGAITASIAFVGAVAKVGADREHRFDQISAFGHALRGDKSAREKNWVLDSLSRLGLADHVQSLAIQTLIDYVRSERRATNNCSAAALFVGDTAQQTRDNINQALYLIRNVQGQAKEQHSGPDFLIDAALSLWQPNWSNSSTIFHLDSADLRGINLSGMKLDSATFRSACLWKVNLTGARMNRANFSSAFLDSAILDSTALDSTLFRRATLRGASIEGGHGFSTDFEHADLTNANLLNTKFDNTIFQSAMLSCATFANAKLSHADFTLATAHWTYFGGASLNDSNHWQNILGLQSAFLIQTNGLSDSMIAFARKSGAIVDANKSAGWELAKVEQLRESGLCAPRKI